MGLKFTDTAVTLDGTAKIPVETATGKGFTTPALILNGTAAAVTSIGNLTGDVTSVNRATTLATVNSNVGSFGGASSIPILTANAKGLITAVSVTAVVAPAGTLSGTTLNSSVVNSSLTSVGTITGGIWNGTIIAPAYLGTGASISTKYLRGDGTWQTIAGGGSGDVVGPASSTNNSLAVFSGATGKLIADGGVVLTDVALKTGTLAQFASTTSAQLATLLSDETGSGAVVFATSPALTTPNIGAAVGTSLTASGALTLGANSTAQWSISTAGILQSANTFITFTPSSGAINAGAITSSNSVTCATSQAFAFSGRAQVRSSGTAAIEFRDSTNANNASITALNATLTGGLVLGTFTVGTFPAATYFLAVVTDALSPVVGATVSAGGSAKCYVAYNGTNKIVIALL